MARGKESVLILGGSGLVGFQVARKLAANGSASKVTLAALTARETLESLRAFRQEFPQVEARGYAGDLFLPGTPHDVEGEVDDGFAPRRDDPEVRAKMFNDLYRDFEEAYRTAFLSQLILKEKPEVVVDAVNTATGISYQDVFTASQNVRADMEGGKSQNLQEDVEKLLVSLSIPQLVLHCRLLNRALMDAGTRLYLKVGTTGTGGMGLNIPYTHGEDRPSPQLLNKTAIAFAQTGMLFLMARTPKAPIIKEIKPAALIGHRGVRFVEAKGNPFVKVSSNGRTVYEHRHGPYTLYRPKAETLESTLDLTPDPEGYEVYTAPSGNTTLKVPLVDTGENGMFTRGEFEAITFLDQMEFITPEEIAEIVALEVRGSGTGSDVITAVDSAVLGSTYKSGMLRAPTIDRLKRLEDIHGVPSVALGRLGPPDLAKHLFEAHLFAKVYGTVEAALEHAHRPAQVAETLMSHVHKDEALASMCVSIGIPILCPDGKTLLRGPMIASPPYRSYETHAEVSEEKLESYVKTWVDLRESRIRAWMETFAKLREARFDTGDGSWSTSEITRDTYVSEDIEIGNVVAWIFNQSDLRRGL